MEFIGNGKLFSIREIQCLKVSPYICSRRHFIIFVVISLILLLHSINHILFDASCKSSTIFQKNDERHHNSFRLLQSVFHITLCFCWVIFHVFCCLLIFFKINFFEKFFQEYHQSVKQLGSRSGPTICRA